MEEAEKGTTQDERSKHAETIIRNHVVWSMGAGFIPILVADVFAVSALQLDMIRQLARVYNIDFSETRGKAIVTSLTSSALARVGAGSLVKLIPGIGSVLGGVTVSVFAGASTYALGEVFKKHFASGGTILDFDPARVKKMYQEKFEKGKKVAREWNKEAKNGSEAESKVDKPSPSPEGKKSSTGTDTLSSLEKLNDLRKSGALTEEEYEKLKKKILAE